MLLKDCDDLHLENEASFSQKKEKKKKKKQKGDYMYHSDMWVY